MKKSVTTKTALKTLERLSLDVITSDMPEKHKSNMLFNIRIQASLSLDAFQEIAEYQARKSMFYLDINLVDRES